MTAPQRRQGGQQFELPRQREYRRPAPIYYERMALRRQEVEREQRRIERAGRDRRAVAAALALAVAAIGIFCGGMALRGRVNEQSAAIARLSEDIYYLRIDSQVFSEKLSAGHDAANIKARALQMGMIE